MQPLIITDLRKSYGHKQALDGVSLAISAGESVGVIGPNGAGKSTLFSIATGVRRPGSGTVRLFGKPPEDATARRALGVVPQETSLPNTLRVQEALDLVSSHFSAPMNNADALEVFGLTSLAGKQCGGLSGGQKRRVMVALAAVPNPQLLVMDEPTVGLDLESRDMLWNWLRTYREAGGSLLVSSHNLSEVEHLAQRVVVLAKGEVIADDSLTGIRSRVNTKTLSFHTGDDPALFEQLPGVTGMECTGRGGVSLVTSDADELVTRMVQEGLDFHELNITGASLEEAFSAMTAAPVGTQ